MRIKIYQKKIGQDGHVFSNIAAVPENIGPSYYIAVREPLSVIPTTSDMTPVPPASARREFRYQDHEPHPDVMLVSRTDAPEGFYEVHHEAGPKFSVVDFSTTMKGHPFPEGIFVGWEAIPLREDGDLDTVQKPIRTQDWPRLRHLLAGCHQGLPRYFEA